ncbi:MAG: UrcA family protein [Hyphomonadaceae bacterium]|nr:UrcA family protein [Hyphomonadaceae bacterium]
MSRFIKSALIALAASLALAPAALAPAALAGKPVTVRISVEYSDLDITRAAGAQTLLHRLDRAADRACGGRIHGRPQSFAARFDACREQALGRAISELDSPLVTALFVRKYETMQLASH